MTMAEIDQRRTDLGALRKQVDEAEASSLAPIDKGNLDSLRYLEACAEANVLVALREWWAQGCREKGLLSEALEHLEAHDYEYHHRTPPEFLARLRTAIAQEVKP